MRPTAIDEVIDWLLDEGQHIIAADALFAGLVPRMRAAGLPIDRLEFGFDLLHPQLAAETVSWNHTLDRPQTQTFPVAIRSTPAYLANPIAVVFSTGATVRRRLDDGPSDFRILPELIAAGYRDYVAMPLRTRGVVGAAITLASLTPDAFDEAGRARLARVLAAVAPIVGTMRAERMTRDVLDTYLGPQTGARVRDGRVQLGDVEQIDAVLWLCDLHDFSTLTHALGAEAMVPLVNSYFEVMAAALVAHGGEILKFMGDAMLAFFPVGDDADRASAQATAAAREALAALEVLSAARVAQGEAALRTSVALDYGRVLYGNIGAERRLDFTVFGPTVNRLTRVERLCGVLEVPILMTAAVAERAGAPVVSLGVHRLKGEGAPVEVFTLA